MQLSTKNEHYNSHVSVQHSTNSPQCQVRVNFSNRETLQNFVAKNDPRYFFGEGRGLMEIGEGGGVGGGG